MTRKTRLCPISSRYRTCVHIARRIAELIRDTLLEPARVARHTALALALIVASSAILSAQADTGRTEPLRLIGVLDATSGDWIDRAVVRDTLGNETTTTRYGVAALNVLTSIAGFYLLEIRKEGYAPRRIRLRADTTIELMLALQRNPLGDATKLPAVVTTERRRIQQDSGQRSGFFNRCQAKTTQCVGRAELDRRSTSTLDNLLSMKDDIHRNCQEALQGPVWTPGPTTKPDDDLIGCLIQMHIRAGFGVYCTPTYFIDGFEWQSLGGTAQAQIDKFLPPNKIEGIEIYLPMSPTPVRFAPPWNSDCGSIVIWTRP
jgi:hypothetical protein